MELIPTLVLILSSSALTAIITAWFNRRKTSAEANSVIVATALEVVENTVAPLNDRIKQVEAESKKLKEEIERQAIALENINAEVLKIQLAFVINEAQIEALGYKAAVSLDDLSCISVEELREIAKGIKEGK